jgi:hypothetical protein
MNEKKNNKKSTKIIITTIFVLVAFFGIRYFKENRVNKNITKNVENDIFDISDEDKKTTEINGRLSEMTLEELKEGGLDFIYQVVLRNQSQISEIKEQNEFLKKQIADYKSSEKIRKIIFSYIDLQKKFYAGEKLDADFDDLELMAMYDETLLDKLSQLRKYLEKFSSAKKISEKFSSLIPDLITTKKYNQNGNWLEKIRYNVSKLVVVRRVDKNSGDIDSIISKTEDLLSQKNYQEALNMLLLLDQSYHSILSNFLDEVSSGADVKRVDLEIMNHLKNS